MSDPDVEDADSGGQKGEEAPSLAALVADGQLPPVAERLPIEPVVVQPNEAIGRYGGTWHTALLGPADTSWLGRTIGYESLMRFDPEWQDVIPNVAADIVPDSEGRTYTITLREGLRWSDGEPFTADDVVFAYEDVHLNTDLSPSVPPALTSAGAPLTMEKIDDYTVQVTFEHPNGMFITRMALDRDGGLLCAYPRHYLEQFHRTYNSDADQLAADEGMADWAELFAAKASVRQWENTEVPTLYPWVLTTALGEGSRVVAERNPYYWKTDPDGSQLPYIDTVDFDVVSDEEVLLLKAANGELDFHSRHINTLPNKPILADSRESGDYRFVEMLNSEMNELVIALNLAHEDQGLREIFQNKDFRVGLSHAINRSELVEAVFQRQGMPWQVAPIEESEFFDEEFAHQYLEYDPDEANRRLDSAGLTERDSEGFRLDDEGRRVSFDVDVATPALIPFWPDGMELIVAYWEEVGVHARINGIDRSLLYERKESGNYDANVWKGDGGFGNETLDPRWYFPFSSESNFATAWGTWYNSAGDAGQEPPEPARRQMELYDEYTATIDAAERVRIFQEIISIAREQFYAIGTIRVPDRYAIASTSLRNVLEGMPEAGSTGYNTPAASNPAQFFYAQ